MRAKHAASDDDNVEGHAAVGDRFISSAANVASQRVQRELGVLNFHSVVGIGGWNQSG